MGQTTIVLAIVIGIYAVYCYILVSNLGHICWYRVKLSNIDCSHEVKTLNLCIFTYILLASFLDSWAS